MKGVTLAAALERAMPALLAEGVDARTMEACAAHAREDLSRTVWMRLADLLSHKPTNAESTEQEKTVERIWLATGIAVKTLFEEQTWNRRDWGETVRSCATREDFLALFRALGIAKEQWTKHGWMAAESGNPPEEGGIGFTVNGLIYEIHEDPRWDGYESFVRWMGEREESMVSRVRACETREDFLALFADVGIPEGKWRAGGWLVKHAKLPVEQGGIGKTLSGLKTAIQDRFDKRYQRFVAWMDGGEYVEETPITERIAACADPAAVFAFFAERGVPEGKWRNVMWMSKGCRKPVEDGGVGKSFLGIVRAVYGDPRWGGSYPQFVAWMDGKEKPDTTMADRVRACVRPEDFDALFDELGIPEDKRTTTTWYDETSPLPKEQGGIGKPLGYVVANIREKFVTWEKFRAFMGKERVTPQWRGKITACVTRDDFLAFFAGLGIPEGKWESYNWLNKTSALPPEQGGIGKPLSGMRSALSEDPRFGGSFTKFVAWMHGADVDDAALLDRLASCATPETVREFLERDFGASPAQWQTMGWLDETAHLPREQGGIARYGSSIYRVLCRRFPGQRYDLFLEWMGIPQKRKRSRPESAKPRKRARRAAPKAAAPETPGVADLPPPPEPEPAEEAEAPLDVVSLFQLCEDKADYLSLIRAMGIEGDEWQNSKRLAGLTRERRKRGQPGYWPLIKLAQDRFGSYGAFVHWMLDLKYETYGERVAACATPADFRAWFDELKVPTDAWRTKNWFIYGAKEPPENGGIGRSIAGVATCISDDERFEAGWDAFCAWMDGVAAPPPVMSKRMANVRTREQYLEFFASIGIPGDNWKTSNWLERVAPLPPEKGGVGMSFQSVAKLLRKRFGTFPGFVAWMDNREALSPRQEVEKLHTPEEFRAFFALHKVPDEKWRNSRWMFGESGLPEAEGGIGKNMSGYYNLIRERFGRFRNFVAWMDGKDAPDPSLGERIAAFAAPADFLAYFAALGVPNQRWRSSLWMGKQSMLPEQEGGIGKNLSGLTAAIAADGRFNGYRAFVAWMDGKDAPDPTYGEKIASLKTPADFLAFFAELGIPGDKWKKVSWMHGALRPKEEGGIGKTLSGVANAIVWNERFGRYGRFVEWMEGVPLNGIEDDAHATRLLLGEAAKFGVTVEELLSTEHVGRFEKQSHVVKAVIEFLRRKRHAE